MSSPPCRSGCVCFQVGRAESPEHVVVKAFLGQEFLVGTRLDYPSLLEDYDAVSIGYRGEPVGDDEAGAPLHETVQ